MLMKMAILWALGFVVFAVLLLPGWALSRRRGQLVVPDLLLAVLPPLLWVSLVAAGVGSQSLGNLAEIPILAVVVAVLYYAKLLLLDIRTRRELLGRD